MPFEFKPGQPASPQAQFVFEASQPPSDENLSSENELTALSHQILQRPSDSESKNSLLYSSHSQEGRKTISKKIGSGRSSRRSEKNLSSAKSKKKRSLLRHLNGLSLKKTQSMVDGPRTTVAKKQIRVSAAASCSSHGSKAISKQVRVAPRSQLFDTQLKKQRTQQPTAKTTEKKTGSSVFSYSAKATEGQHARGAYCDEPMSSAVLESSEQSCPSALADDAKSYVHPLLGFAIDEAFPRHQPLHNCFVMREASMEGTPHDGTNPWSFNARDNTCEYEEAEIKIPANPNKFIHNDQDGGRRRRARYSRIDCMTNGQRILHSVKKDLFNVGQRHMLTSSSSGSPMNGCDLESQERSRFSQIREEHLEESPPEHQDCSMISVG